MTAKSRKLVAKLTRWDSQEETLPIKKDWIEDIVFAVKGQFFVTNLQTNLKFHGEDYSKVDIYEVQ